MTDQDREVGHHAEPLLESEWQLCQHMRKWIETVRKSGNGWYGPEWLPSDIDMLKSRLFWRIRTGKEPLDSPPPCAYSCPWYELIELKGPHDCADLHESGDSVTICQTTYKRIGDGLCTFGPWTFRYWQDGTFPETNMARWWVERVTVEGPGP